MKKVYTQFCLYLLTQVGNCVFKIVLGVHKFDAKPPLSVQYSWNFSYRPNLCKLDYEL